MKSKIRNYKKRIIAVAALLTIMTSAIIGVSISKNTMADVNKPGAVKNLKKVKTTKNSIKIKYKKVKGADKYQILIYERVEDDGAPRKTPLVYAFDTKKTTYTIKNLVPGCKYTIKVRAWKNGVHGKFKSVKAKTEGTWCGDCIVCNSCGVSVPKHKFNKAVIDYTYLCEHGKAVSEVLGEMHGGGLIW